MQGRVIKSISTSPELWDEIKLLARKEGLSVSSIVIRALSQYLSTMVVRSSWQTEEESAWYDERKFYTYSEDKKGHSSYVRLWIPKNLAGQIGRVVNSGQIPEYRSSQDFYRDALFHRAHQVGKWLDDGALKTELDMAMLMAEEQEIAQRRRDFDLLITDMRENLEEAWNSGHYELLEARVKNRLDKAGSVPEHFQPEYVKLLKEYQGRLAEVKKGKVRRMGRQKPETAND